MAVTQTTVLAARARTMRRLLQLLSSIRFDEVLVLQGTPLLGALFAMGPDRRGADRGRASDRADWLEQRGGRQRFR